MTDADHARYAGDHGSAARMKAAALYAVLWDYDLMVEALNERRVEMGLSCEELEQRAGLGEHYAGRVLGPSHSKKLGFEVAFKIAQHVGLRFALLSDQKAAAAILAGRAPRMESNVRSNNYSRKPAMRIYQRVRREMSRRGAQKLNASLMPEQRSANGRKGALIRWAAASAPKSGRSAAGSASRRKRKPAPGAATRQAPTPSPCRRA